MGTADDRQLIPGNSPFEPIIGFSRAIRCGKFISVSGTAPVNPDGTSAGGDDPALQMASCLEIIREVSGTRRLPSRSHRSHPHLPHQCGRLGSSRSRPWQILHLHPSSLHHGCCGRAPAPRMESRSGSGRHHPLRKARPMPKLSIKDLDLAEQARLYARRLQRAPHRRRH